MKKERIQQIYHLYLNANDPEYVKQHRDQYEILIGNQKKFKPEECICCLFFYWRREEGKVIPGCTIHEGMKYEEEARAKGCPLDRTEDAEE